MVKKLIKHEFIYYIRTLAIFLPLVLLIGVMARVIQFFDSDTFVYSIVSGSSLLMLYVASMACILLTTVLSVVRFYRNMYTSEGYLSFTLPVTNSQHLFVKLFASVIFFGLSIITVVISAAIAFSGEALQEAVKAFKYMMDTAILNHIEPIHKAFFGVEVFILFLLSAISTPLLYYTCITIGQTARKNRILSAVGVYFLFYIATQIISTVITVVVMIAGEMGILDGVFEFADYHTYAFMHILFISSIIISAAFATLMFIVNVRIMSKKLNLE